MDAEPFLQEGHASLIDVLEVNRVRLSDIDCSLETLLRAQTDHALEVSRGCPLRLSFHSLSD
jgi:hypothetical protein